MQILAPAKVNLFLKVISKRKDNYHNILSLIQTISLYDFIEMQPMNKESIIVETNISYINRKNNLCYKVAEFFKKLYKIKYGIKIKIKKNIPIGAGLGGASSDAASVIEGLIKLFNLKVDIQKISKLVSVFGKDIPFFLYKGLCLVKKTGEEVLKIEDYPWKNKPLWFVLVCPEKTLLTKDVYRMYDRLKIKDNLKISASKILKYVEDGRIDLLLHNSLEKAAFEMLPELESIKKIMEKYTSFVSMSGSGSTIYAVFDTKNKAETFKKNLKLKNSKIYLVQSI